MTTQIKDKLHFVSNGDETITLHYGSISVEKDAYRDMFYLPSIEATFAKSLKVKNIYFRSFLRTDNFYQQLCLEDGDLPKYGNVYLMANKKVKTFKVGRTYNYDVRYNEEKKKELVKCIPVKKDNIVESKLLKYFKANYELVAKTRETFKYEGDFKVVEEEFDSLITTTDRVKEDITKSKHISDKYSTMDRQGLWGSLAVFKILVNNYIEDPIERSRYGFLIDNIAKIISNDSYVYKEHNNMLKTDCTYWKFHKYTIIQNDLDDMVNGSRLWNSIKKIDSIKTKLSLKTFLESKFIQDKKDGFAKAYPGSVMYTDKYVNKEQPQFNGIYIHYSLVVYIVDKLNSEYGFIIAGMVFKQYRKPMSKKDVETKLQSLLSKPYSQVPQFRTFSEMNTFMNRMIEK